MAFQRGVLAAFVTGHQLQHAQGQGFGLIIECVQGIQSDLATRRFGGEEEQLVHTLTWHRFERRINGAHRLADTRRGLGQQATPRHAGFVDGLRQRALAFAKLTVREVERHQCAVTGRAMGGFKICPHQKALAQGLKKQAQGGGIVLLTENRFFLTRDVEVNQRYLHGCKAGLLAHQPRINLGLRPVQLAVVVRDALYVSTMGFDLFEAVEYRVITVSTAPHAQVAMAAVQRHLTLILRAAPGGDFHVPSDALHGCGRGREA